MIVDRIILLTAIVLLLLLLISLYRVIGGPTVLDRIMGGNIVGTKTTVLLLLVGILYNDLGMFVDIAIAYALLNFIATLGATRFFLRKRNTSEIIEAALEQEDELPVEAEASEGGN
jgi:multicomponent Na+:H+ antiporter subunit F